MKTLKVTHEGKQYFVDVEQERPLETLLRKFCITIDDVFEECISDLELLKKEYGLLTVKVIGCTFNPYPSLGIEQTRQAQRQLNSTAAELAERQALGMAAFELQSMARGSLHYGGQFR